MATNIIKNGNLDADFKVGSSDCKIYLGDVLLYPHTPSAAKFSATYSGGQTYSAECNSSTSLASGETRPSGYAYTAMTSAAIGDCVTNIGDYAFQNCNSLSSATIGSGVTSIGNYAFNNCSGLTSIDIPSGVTSIGLSAFRYCSGLTEVTIPNNVTYIGQYAFRNCASLTSVTIGSGVTSIVNSAFADCTSLTSVTINATSVPTLGGTNVFSNSNCPIYVPCSSVDAYKAANNWSTYASRIQGIPPCGEPQSAKFYAEYSNGDTATVNCNSSSELIEDETKPMFSPYYLMTSAEIGDCVTTIGANAFQGCGALSSITISSSVTSIESAACHSCYALSSVTIPDGVTSIGYVAFQYCSGLTDVTIGSGVTSIGVLGFQSCTSLSSLTIPDSVTTIGQQAFEGCFALSSVTIGSGVTSIGGSAFGSCSALTSVTINATTPPTLVSSAFYDTNNCPIYVPCESVNAYKAASDWSTYADRIRCATIQEPCFDVVDDISSYSGTDYVDVYAEDDSKWYKLNNLNEYEEYGIYETGSSLSAFTYYDGKLVAVGTDEYDYNGTMNQWELVGEYNPPQTFEIISEDSMRYQGKLFPTTFKIPIADCNNRFITVYGQGGAQIDLNLGEWGCYYSASINGNSYNGTVTSDSDYNYFSLFGNNEVHSIVIDNISYNDWSQSGPVHIIETDASSYEISHDAYDEFRGYGMPTTFKIPYDEYGAYFQVDDYHRTVIRVADGEYYCYDENLGDMVSGTVTNDGDYYYFTAPSGAVESFVIFAVRCLTAGDDFHIVFGGGEVTIKYVDKDAPEDNVEFSTMADALEYECPWVGMAASIDDVPYIFSDSYEWLTKYDYVVVSGQYICSGGNKYEKLEQKIRNTDGTWSSQSPAVYRQGALIEAHSQDCPICTINFCGTNSTGGTISIDNGTSRITGISNAVNGDVGTATQTIGAYCFGGSQLTSLTIANTVTTIEHEAFNETDGLTTLTIPSSVTQIDFWAFTRCTGLTEVIFEGTTPPTFTNQHSGVFHDYCPPVIYVPNESVSVYRAIDGSVWTNQTWSTNIIQPISSRN